MAFGKLYQEFQKMNTIQNISKLLLFTSMIVLYNSSSFSQDTTGTNEPNTEYAENIFTGTQLINSQTTNTLLAKSRTFEIQHRFGKVGLDSGTVQQFLGLDLPSVIRLSLGWSASDRLYFKIGRTNYLKTVDLEGKYLLIRQPNDKRVPVSVAFYFNASARTEKFPNVAKGAVFENSGKPFKYKFTHRLIYNSELIVSSKLSERITFLLTSAFIYRNLVSSGQDNYTMAISAGGRYKFGLSSSMIFEYAHMINNRTKNFQNPFSIGVEFGTVGHIFQIIISSSNKILESHVYTSSAGNVGKGEFFIGFNIQRIFWKKVKQE